MVFLHPITVHETVFPILARMKGNFSVAKPAAVKANTNIH